MRHLIAVLPLALLAAHPAQAQMVTITPAQIGEIFCIGSLGNDMAPVEALLTPDLSATLKDALDRSDAIQAAHPDEKPPLGDGVPWRGWQDYADACTVGDAATTGETASVTISYGFTEYPDANYSNDLQLKPVVTQPGFDPFWRIDDIDLGQGRTLRSALGDAFAGY